MLHLTLPSFGQYESPISGGGQFINQRILCSPTMSCTLSSMDIYSLTMGQLHHLETLRTNWQQYGTTSQITPSILSTSHYVQYLALKWRDANVTIKYVEERLQLFSVHIQQTKTKKLSCQHMYITVTAHR